MIMLEQNNTTTKFTLKVIKINYIRITKLNYMSTLLSDYQFCQIENDLLRNKVKTLKMDINFIKMDINFINKELTELFKEKQFHDPNSKLQFGAVILNPEDQQKVLEIINKVIKTN